jgi:hypothetical protein
MFRAVGVDGRTFNNFGGLAITNVYNKTVINNTTINAGELQRRHRRMFCDVTATVRQKARLPVWVMCGRRPHCKKNLTFGLRSGASHVSGLFARHHDRWP